MAGLWSRETALQLSAGYRCELCGGTAAVRDGRVCVEHLLGCRRLRSASGENAAA